MGTLIFRTRPIACSDNLAYSEDMSKPITETITFQCHWARTNRADEILAVRAGAVGHATREAAEREAASITPTRPDIVPIVVKCCRYT